MDEARFEMIDRNKDRYLQQKSSLPIPQRTNWFEHKTGCKPTKQDEKEI